MNLLINLLVVVAATGAIGSARADEDRNPVARAPVIPDSRFASGIAASYSFADVVNYADGAGRHQVTSRTLDPMRDVPPVDLANAGGLAPTPVATANARGSLFGAVSILNSTVGDLSAGVVPGDFSSPRPGASGPSASAKFPFPVSEMPDPADWMTLLCGLIVVAFMARRKSNLLSN